MPSKQDIYTITTSTLSLLLDLTSSLIGYCLLMHALFSILKTIAWVSYQTGLPFNHTIITLSDPHGDIAKWTALSLWAVRLMLRCRGHLVCILRWLSPLAPEAFVACPCCCWTDMYREPGKGEEPRSEGWREREERGIGIFL